MKTRTLIGAALLLSTTGIGIALAASELHSLDLFGAERHERRDAAGPASGAMRIAESKSEHKRDGARDHRHREDDDDDDDDDDDGARGGRSATPQAGPTDPNAPVPDNGLFKGNARPKVEVQ